MLNEVNKNIVLDQIVSSQATISSTIVHNDDTYIVTIKSVSAERINDIKTSSQENSYSITVTKENSLESFSATLCVKSKVNSTNELFKNAMLDRDAFYTFFNIQQIAPGIISEFNSPNKTIVKLNSEIICKNLTQTLKDNISNKNNHEVSVNNTSILSKIYSLFSVNYKEKQILKGLSDEYIQVPIRAKVTTNKKTTEIKNNILKPVENDQFTQLFKTFGIPSNYISCFNKFVRTEENNSFNAKDLHQLTQLEAMIEKKIDSGKINDSKLDQLKELQKIVKSNRQELINSITIKLDKINKFDFQFLEKSNPTDLCPKCHDLYWSFNSPFETSIDFKDFLQLCHVIKSDKNHPLHSQVSKNSEQIEKLSEHGKKITHYGNGDGYREFYMKNPELAKAHKKEFIRSIRTTNLEKLKGKEPNVLIIGAGPGGLMRGLVGALKGVNTTIVEKRDTNTRSNMVKISNLKMLDFFGVRDHLITQNQIFLTDEFTSVSISSLQNALDDSIKTLFDGEISKKTGYEVSEIKSQDGKTVCNCKGKDKTEISFQPDIIVDSSGAGASVAKLIGNERKVVSSAKSMMVAAVFNLNGNRKSEENSEIKKTRNSLQVQLDRPGMQYELILPGETQQKKLFKIEETMSKTIPGTDQWERLIKQKNELLKEIAIAAGKKHGLSEEEAKNNINMLSSFPIDVSHRRPCSIVGNCIVQQSGDSLATPDPLSGTGCLTALKGATVFSRSLDDLIENKSKEEQFQNYNYGSKVQTDFLISKSLFMRSIGMVLSGRLTDTARTIGDLVKFKLQN